MLRLITLKPRAYRATQRNLSAFSSTLIRWASKSQWRFKAASIAPLASVVLAWGLTSTRLLSPLTPSRYLTASSAVVFWYLQSTVPLSVSQPLET